MNKKELAKLLLKHPLIKKINESQMWDKSIVSRTIAEELLAEDKKSAAEMKAAIDLLVKEIGGMKKAIDDLLDERDLRDSLGEDEKSEQAKKAAIELIRKKREKIKELDKLETDYESLSTRAAATPETADDKAVEDAALKDAEELEDAQAELPSPEEVKADPSGKASQISQALDKISTDNVEDAASAIENKPTAEEIQKSYSTIKALLPTLGNKKEPLKSVLATLVSKMKEEGITEPQEPSAPEGEQMMLPLPKPNLEDVRSINKKIEAVKQGIKWSPADAIGKKLNKLQGEDATRFLTNLQKAIETGDINEFIRLMNVREPRDAKFEKAMEFLEGKPNFFKDKMAAIKEKLQQSGTLEDAKQYLMVIADVAHAAAEVEEKFGTESQTAIALMDKVVDELVATPGNDLDATLDSFKKEAVASSLRSAILEGMKRWVANEKISSAASEAEISDLLGKENFLIWLFFQIREKKPELMREQEESVIDLPKGTKRTLTEEEVADLVSDLKGKMTEIYEFLKKINLEKGDQITGPESETGKISSGDTEEEQKKISQQDKEQAMMVLANLDIPNEVLFSAAESIGVDPNTVVASPASDEEQVKVSDEEEVEQSTDVTDEEEVEQSTDVTDEEAQEDAQEDVQPERQTPPQVYADQHYKTIATFFADEDAEGLGFMQQLLLRRQSEQLYGLISALNELIDPTGGEERALNEDNGDSEEEAPNQQPTPELSSGQKRKLKSELIGLLSALKGLKTLSKAYEENLTRTSVDPRYDGSSLKSRLDAMLPEIQSSIARILKMISEFIAELPKTEPKNAEENLQEQEGEGLDRQGKIDLVADTYKEMRKSWNVLKPALKERLPKAQPEPEEAEEQKPEEELNEREDASLATETVITAAKEIKELATGKPFITFFPTITFSQGGQVVSIEQANKVLSGVISQFVYVMRNVIALVKGEQITEGTANEVRDKLAAISQAIEKNFGVPAARIVKQIEKETAGDPENQSLTDTPANNNNFFDAPGSTEEPEDEEEGGETDELGSPEETEDTRIQKYIRNKMRKDGEDISLPLTAFVENFAKNVEAFYRSELSESVLSKSKNMAKKLWSKMTKEDRRWASKIAEKIMEDLKPEDHRILQDKNEFLKILVGSISEEAEDYVDFFKEMKYTSTADIGRVLKDIIERKGKIILEEPSGSIEEALKPIIAKMLKEHYG